MNNDNYSLYLNNHNRNLKISKALLKS